MAETTVSLPDGRVLQVWVEGPAGGDVVIRHHGTPSSGLPYRPSVEQASERGLRHVTYSRPGYGGSARDEGRSIADCAADVVRIADSLGVHRFYSGGGSGGGPHAIACAALMPERVLAVASVAGITPYHAGGIDFLAGMGRDNVVEFGAAADGPEALRAWMDENAAATGQASSADELIAAFGDEVSEVDQASLTGEFGEHMVRNERLALAGGDWGWFDDDLALVRDWGFDPASIRVPVSVWQGAQDRFVPFAHGEWLAAHIPSARPHLYQEHGHMSLALATFGQILDDLVEMGKA